MCPAYGQEYRKCKKNNHWTRYSQSKVINETKQYMIETITECDTANVNALEATAIIKIEGSYVNSTLEHKLCQRVSCQRESTISCRRATRRLQKLHLSCMVMENMIFQLLARLDYDAELMMFKNRQISMWHIKKQDDFRIKELQRYDISENHG